MCLACDEPGLGPSITGSPEPRSGHGGLQSKAGVAWVISGAIHPCGLLLYHQYDGLRIALEAPRSLRHHLAGPISPKESCVLSQMDCNSFISLTYQRGTSG